MKIICLIINLKKTILPQKTLIILIYSLTNKESKKVKACTEWEDLGH